MGILRSLLYAYVAILMAAALLSWFPSSSDGMRQTKRFLARLTEPVIAPVRRMLPQTGGIDFSIFLVTFVLLFIARSL